MDTEIYQTWATKGDDEAADAVMTIAGKVLARQGSLQSERMVLGALYDGSMLRSMTGAFEESSTGVPDNMLTLNVCKTMVDAATARIAARNPPRAVVTTEDGTWRDQLRGKRMTLAIDGAMAQQRAVNKHVRAFRTACIFGSGEILVDRWHGRLRITRARPGDFFVDERECENEEPRRLYRRSLVDRAVLASAFPRMKKQILEMSRDNSMTDELMWGLDRDTDGLVVVEGWSLPSGPNAKDGRYVAVVGGQMLESFEYDREVFPISRMCWCPPEFGWYGTGLVKELMPIQLEVNDLMDRINDAQKVVAGKWLVEAKSGVNTSHITDERDAILVYRGTAPTYITPNAIPPQMYEHLWNLWQKAFEVTGISQLSASSMKPAGLNSGVALRAYRDGESERFGPKSLDYQDMVLDTARHVVYELNAMAEEDPDLVIRYIGEDAVKTISWAKERVEEGSYDLKIQAMSGMPNTPAARLELVEQLAKMQIFEPRPLAKMLASGIPDIEAIVMEANAAEELTRKVVTHIVETGEYIAPEPEMQPEIAMTVAQQMYLDFRRRGASIDDLEDVARWINDVASIIEQKNPPPPPQGPGGEPGGPPGGGPPPGMMPPPEGP